MVGLLLNARHYNQGASVTLTDDGNSHNWHWELKRQAAKNWEHLKYQPS